MTAAVPVATSRSTSEPVPDVLAGYQAHVAGLPMNSSSRCARLRAARQFLVRHPDLAAWMDTSTPARLSDLHRAKAWPFASWCLVRGHLRPDLELILGKPGGADLPSAWAAYHPGDVERVAAAGQRLRWSENWTRQVSRLALPTLCLHAGTGLDGLNDEHFTAALEELDGAAFVSTSARTRVRTRLFALRQACYQLGVVAHPATAARWRTARPSSPPRSLSPRSAAR